MRIPNKQPGEGRTLLLLVPNYWGKGPTVADCKAAIRTNGSRASKALTGGPYRLYSAHPDTYVDDFGMVIMPKGNSLELLASHD